MDYIARGGVAEGYGEYDGGRGRVVAKVLDSNRQKYKKMLSLLAVSDSTEEEYRKARVFGSLTVG